MRLENCHMSKQLNHEDWAVINYLRDRTVRILDFTDKSAGGTGVKIVLKEKYFVATAAHVIPKSHEIRLLVKGSSNVFIRNFLDWKTQEDIDLGLLEISSSDAELLGGEFVHATEICVEFPFEEKWLVVVCGYPGQMIGISDERNGVDIERTYDFRPMAFFTGTLSRESWPTESSNREIVDDAELFIRFEENAPCERINFGEATPSLNATDLAPFRPAGMSGGGIWSDSRPRGTEIWSPQPLLLAIQSSVSVKAKWMRGSRISKWAELAGYGQGILKAPEGESL